MCEKFELKPIVDVTCKLGTKGCFEDGRCHAIGNCENKIVTNADRIRAMSDEELAEFLLYNIDRDAYGTTKINKDLIFSKLDMMCWLEQPVEEDA